jgi:hypothetical protein
MTSFLAVSAALAELAYVVLVGFFCLLTNLHGSRMPGRLTRRVLPLSKSARRSKARQRLLVGRLARDMGIQVEPAEWRRIANEGERWQAALVGLAFTWMWPIFIGLIGLCWLSWPFGGLPEQKALKLAFSAAILIAYAFGYLDYRLTEPKIARAAIFNDALAALALCAGDVLPRTKQLRTRKQLISLGVHTLHRHLEVFAKRRPKFDGSQYKSVSIHVLRVAASLHATTERMHGQDDRQAQEDLARDLTQIMISLLHGRSGHLLPAERLGEVPERLPRRELPIWPVVFIYGATVVAIGACAWVLGRIQAAAVVSAVTGLLTAVPAILAARWLGKPAPSTPGQPPSPQQASAQDNAAQPAETPT